MFTASTWEEFKMISAENKYMEEAGKTLFTLNGDDQIREQCEAREDYRRTWAGVKQEMEELKSSNEELKSLNENKNTVIEELRSSNEELKSLNVKNNTIIEELKSSNEEKDALIASLQAQLAGAKNEP